jgi:hypothetical protein
MIQLHKIAGKIMSSLEAFEGSRPAIDAPEILIVKGISKKKIGAQDMALELSNLLDELGAKQIELYSDEAGDIIELIDENIRSNVEIQGETDIYGIYRMKQSLEALNCDVEYAMGLLDDVGVFIVMWADKSGLGPRFVEAVVSNTELTEDA